MSSRPYLGVSSRLWNVLMTKQHKKCAVCKIEFAPIWYARPNVDHDHATNKIRGLLCSSCNRGIGYFRDNPGVLKSAARYLECPTTNIPIVPLKKLKKQNLLRKRRNKWWV